MTHSINALAANKMVRELKDYVLIAIGMVMYGIGWTLFLLPNEITLGGLPGIASIVFWGTGIPVQYTYFSINFILLIISVKVLGWKFSVKTIFAVFSLTVFLLFIEQLTAGVTLLQDDPLTSCILGATLCGGGVGIAFSANGSSGGTDIVAAVIHKYRDVSLGRIIMILNMTIVGCSYFVLKDWAQVVYGYITLYLCSFMIDRIVNSSRQSVQFFIISQKYEEIGHAINALHRGVTVFDATGLYTGNPQKVMFVLARGSQSSTIFRIINDIDPQAFVSQSSVIGVYGEGFDRFKVSGKRKALQNNPKE